MTSTSISATGIKCSNDEAEQTSPYPNIGTILMWAGGFGIDQCPSGWLICDGSSYPKNDYPELYDVIDTTFGGDNDYFNVPNLVKRVPIGGDTMDGSDYTINSENTGGTNLITSEYFNHTHIFAEQTVVKFAGNTGFTIDDSSSTAVDRPVSYEAPNYNIIETSMPTLNGQLHNGIQSNYYPPYILILYIICSNV